MGSLGVHGDSGGGGLFLGITASIIQRSPDVMLVQSKTLELTLVFGVLPLALTAVASQPPVIVPLLVASAVCLVVLLRDTRFERRRLWAGGAVRQALPGIILRWLIGWLVFGAAIYWLRPGDLFAFPRHNPRMWVVVMVLYPLLSAWPQEIIFRAFFEHRYRRLLGPALVVTSAVAFAWVHILFRNWLAVVLTFPAGLLFMTTYRRRRSLACSTIEHALWGDLVFTIGLGRYFYSGS